MPIRLSEFADQDHRILRQAIEQAVIGEGSGPATWGFIGGTLADQDDLG